MGGTPGGFLTGMWGVIGPDIEKKHADQLELQKQQKSAELSTLWNSMSTNSQRAIQLKAKADSGTQLTPEEMQELQRTVADWKWSHDQSDKLTKSNKPLNETIQKVGGVVNRMLTSKRKPQGQAQAPGGAPGQAPAQQGPQYSTAQTGWAPQQLPSPQTAMPEIPPEMRAMAAGSVDPREAQAGRDRDRRQKYVEQNGKDWTSQEKGEFIETGKFPTGRRAGALSERLALLTEAYTQKGEADPEGKAFQDLIDEEKQKTEGKKKLTAGWAVYPGDKGDAELHAIVDDLYHPGHLIDESTGKPAPEGAFKVNPTIRTTKLKMQTYGAFGNYYRAAMGQPGMTDEQAQQIAGEMVFRDYGIRLEQREQQYAIDTFLSGGMTGTGMKLPGVQGQAVQPPAAAPGAAPGQPPAAPPAQPTAAAPVAQAPGPSAPQFAPLEGANAPREQASAQYAPLISKAAADNGVDPNLLTALIRTESAFDPNAVSPKGAIGMGQFMPKTAKQQGLANPRDPQQAIPAAAKLLAQLRDQYQGDMRLALAAYNAGPEAVKRAGGDLTKLPQETQDYVKKILGDRASANRAQADGGRTVTITPPDRQYADDFSDPRVIAPNERTPVLAYLSSVYGTQTGGGGGKAGAAGRLLGQTVLARVTGLDPQDFELAAAVAKNKVKALGDTVERYASMIRITNAMDAISPELLRGAQEAIQSGSPWFTRRLRDIELSAVDDPPTRAYLTTLQDFVRHYSTVTAGGTQSRAMLPVSVAAEADKLLDKNMTLGATVAVVEQIRKNAELEKKAFQDTVTDIKNEARGFGRPPGTPETTREKPAGATGKSAADNKKEADDFLRKEYGIKPK